MNPSELIAAIQARGPLGTFPWHRQQEFALASATNAVVVLGGNQSGKSSVAGGIVSRVVRREGPIYRRLRNPENRPLKIWVSPQTFEKYKSNWEKRLRDEVFAGMEVAEGTGKPHYVQSPQPVFRWTDPCSKGNELWGKCLPLTEPVLMADGTRKPLGEIGPGDQVLGGDGRPTRVVGVSRSGIKLVWRLVLQGGRTLHVTDEHVVPVLRGKDAPVYELSLAEIRRTTGADARRGWKLFVPARRDYLAVADLPIPPYTLGVLLGDGHLSDDGVTITSADAAVVNRVRGELASMGCGLSALSDRHIGYCVTQGHHGPFPGPFTRALRGLGLMGKRSHNKFIPCEYLRGSHDDRLALAEGLVDSDGSRHTYTSISEQLATDFAALIESIGGRARLPTSRLSVAVNAVDHKGTVSYRCNWVRHGLNVLPRKRPTSSVHFDTTLRRFESCEMVGFAECGDIAVDNERHWFVAGDAEVVVHNSQDQGFMAFESDVVDLIIFDEEPSDRRLYTSAQQRLATTNGVIVFAFTPLLGLSWTHGTFYVPTVRDEYKVADRVWKRGNSITVISMGMADNPASVAGGGVARIQADPSIAEAERLTRLHGHYGFTEGLIFPQFNMLQTEADDSPYLLDELPAGRPYSWVLTADPNKRHGGLLTAIDHEGNRYYVAEHYAESLPDRRHAEAYRAILATRSLQDKHGVIVPTVGIYADPGGAGAQAIINLADTGIFAQPVPKDAGSVKASIELIRRAAWIDPNHRHPVTGRIGAPHCYFLRSLKSTWKQDGVEYSESRLMWELRQYRQKEKAPPDTPVKEHDDLVDCQRYLELVRPFVPLVTDTSEQQARSKLDKISRRANDEFDEVVRKATQQKRERADVW